MKWIIKNPAPSGTRGKEWGDYHFGRLLCKWLERFGQAVDTDYHDDWETRENADVILVLRGRHPYTGHAGGFRVLWIISHPETVSVDECAGYDLVFVASTRHADLLRSRLDRPVYPLLQCTDTEHFRPVQRVRNLPRPDCVFVGNARNAKRESVLWAAEAGLPLKVWGRGWEKWIDGRFVVADHLAYDKLPEVYTRAKVVFNDHWPDMRGFGYVNNRVFDALACGSPVISDHLDELEELFAGAVLSFESKQQFATCVERLLLEYPNVLSRVHGLMPLIRDQHTFESRTRRLLELTTRHFA